MQRSSDTNPWERQPKEGEKPYEAFVKYRDMGDKRTLQAVAAELQKSYTLIRRWKDTWNWEERVRAYDNELQKQAHKQAVKKAKGMADRHIDLALKMQLKALEALAELDPKTIDPKALISLIREGTRLERENREDVVRMTEPVKDEETGQGSGSLADMISAAWERRQNDDKS